MEHDESRPGTAPRQRTAEMADQLVDELLPEDLDWRRLVRTYPFPVVALAVGVGFILGRHRGQILLTALGGFAVHQATRNFSKALERAGIAVPMEDSASTRGSA